VSGSSSVSGRMLIAMPGINERSGELGGLTPKELALIEACLCEARATVERLLRRADELTARVESRRRQGVQGGRVARRAREERHESC